MSFLHNCAKDDVLQQRSANESCCQEQKPSEILSALMLCQFKQSMRLQARQMLHGGGVIGLLGGACPKQGSLPTPGQVQDEQGLLPMTGDRSRE